MFLDTFHPSRDLVDGASLPAPAVPASTRISARLKRAAKAVQPRVCWLCSVRAYMKAWVANYEISDYLQAMLGCARCPGIDRPSRKLIWQALFWNVQAMLHNNALHADAYGGIIYEAFPMHAPYFCIKSTT